MKPSILLILVTTATIVSLSKSKSTKSLYLVEEPQKVEDEEDKIEHYKLDEVEEGMADIFDESMQMMEKYQPECPQEEIEEGGDKNLERKLVPSPIKLDEMDKMLDSQAQQDRNFGFGQKRFSRDGSEQDFEDKMAIWFKLWREFFLYHTKGKGELNLLRDLFVSVPVTRASQSDISNASKPEVGLSSVSRVSEISEIDQQNSQHYREPILMYTMEQDKLAELRTRPLNSIENVKIEDDFDESSQPDDLVVGSASAERARNSLLKAADVARQLAGLPASSTRRPIPLSEPANPRLTTNSPENQRSSLFGSTTQMVPKFLGFGQLQRIEPFGGNGRTQARLSCQFGNEGPQSNVTISNVEWAKFDNYPANQDGDQPFDCKRTVPGVSASKCRMFPVKTNTLTTVHPRPAIQNYINTMVPSYSVTLHEVSDEHLGVYRCSAMRQFGEDRAELVYRIIQFE